METKSFPIAHLKALEANEQDGTFEAVTSIFGNTDRYDDRVFQGAFVDDLAKGFAPCVWTHQWGTVPIGVTLDMYEIDRKQLTQLLPDIEFGPEVTGGLYGKAQLLVDAHDVARQVYAAMKTVGGDGRPALREFSFAYDIITGGWEVENEEEYYALRQLSLIEWGPCLKGVNDRTGLVAVKGDAPADGRVRPQRPSEKANGERCADCGKYTTAEDQGVCPECSKSSPSEDGAEGNAKANPPEGGEEPTPRTPSQAYLDIKYAD
jgi:uncharacterized protein